MHPEAWQNASTQYWTPSGINAGSSVSVVISNNCLRHCLSADLQVGTDSISNKMISRTFVAGANQLNQQLNKQSIPRPNGTGTEVAGNTNANTTRNSTKGHLTH
jgi:hypothetical protein